MAYFLILPAFVLYLLAMAIALVVTSFHEPSRWMRPYLASILLWSSIGFVVSSILYVAILLVAVRVMDAIGGRPPAIVAFLMGGIIFIAPLLLSAGGLVVGAVYGMKRRSRSLGGSVRLEVG